MQCSLASPNTTCTYCPSHQDPLNLCKDKAQFCYPFVFPQHFFNDGCKVSHQQWFLPLLACFAAAVVAFVWHARGVWGWDDKHPGDVEREGSNSKVPLVAVDAGGELQEAKTRDEL